jgi:ABC-type multidrug transport system fused ATPase/permease subunit
LAILFAVQVVGGRIAAWQCFLISTKISNSWTYCSLKAFFAHPMHWHDKKPSGIIGLSAFTFPPCLGILTLHILASQLLDGQHSIWALVDNFISQDLLLNIFTLIFILFTAISTETSFWWIFILPIPIYIVLVKYLGQRAAELQAQCNPLKNQARVFFHDSISNVKLAKMFDRGEDETKLFAQWWGSYHDARYQMAPIEAAQAAADSGLFLLFRLLVLVLGLVRLKEGTMTVGSLMTLLAFQSMSSGPISRIYSVTSSSLNHIRGSLPLFEIIFAEETEPNKALSKPLRSQFRSSSPSPSPSLPAKAPRRKSIALQPLRRQIKIRNVSFEYKHEASTSVALGKINLTIPKGSFVSIIGPNGSGKSTLLNLIHKLYSPTEGSILWDDIDIKDVSFKSLRKKVVSVPQDTFLLNRSIADNISYGSKNATREEIETAAKKARVHEFIMATSHGYDTIVGAFLSWSSI